MDQHPMFAKKNTKTGDSSHPHGDGPKNQVLSTLFTTAIARLENARDVGLTWAELGELESLHHGRVTSLLSNLHRQGHVVRLRARRSGTRGSVYVLPQYVNGRPVAEYRGTKGTAAIKENEELTTRIKELENQVALFGNRTAELEAQIRELTNRAEAAEALAEERAESIGGLSLEIGKLTDKLADRDVRLHAALTEHYLIDQAAGKAIGGFPEAYPHVSDVDNGDVVTGEHTPVSIVHALIEKLTETRSALASVRETLATERDAVSSARPAVRPLTGEETAFVSRIARVVGGKTDSAVQPIKAGTIKALLSLIDRIPGE